MYSSINLQWEMGAGARQQNFWKRWTGNRYVDKEVLYMRLLVCWGLTEIYHQLGGMLHLPRATNDRGAQGVQGWPKDSHPDNNSSGGQITPRKDVSTQSQSRGQSDSSRGLHIDRQGENSLQETGREQQTQLPDVATVAGILASRTAIESMPISSQAVQLRTYVIDTLFHMMVHFIESTSCWETMVL